MKHLKALDLLSMGFAASLLYLLDFYGLWVLFLSHPFWSAKATMIGIVSGMLLTLALFILAQDKMRRLAIGFICLCLLAVTAFFVTIEAKELFAASYAENQLAGKIWYFGFIGMIASIFGGLSLLVTLFLANVTSE